MDKIILHKIINKWGRETQINKIQEELLELCLVLNQINCPTKDPKEIEAKLYDELADAKIMMAQADILFDEDRINDRVKFKLDKCNKKYLS
jgi:NTP pyrophosphatase (non-canonical NTP hydrolase)